MGNDPGVLVKTVARNLRQRRLERGLSLSDLARRSYVAKATVSALESGKGNPTIDTIGALAHALGVPSVDLLAEPEVSVQTVRLSQRVAGAAAEGSFVERLVGRGLVELYELSCPPGSRTESPPHSPGAVEHVFVTRGRLTAGPVKDPVDLRSGDLAHFAADQPHLYAAPGGSAKAIVLVSYP